MKIEFIKEREILMKKLNDAENKKFNNSNKLNGKSLIEQIMWRTECPSRTEDEVDELDHLVKV